MKKQSTFKMKGFSGFKDESPVKNVFDTKKQKQTLKEYKSQQKDFLSNKDITANQDTVRQSGVDYFKKYQFGPKASDGTGNVSTHYIKEYRKGQVNKNIDTFENMFENNFILVNNDPKGADKTYNEKEIKKYFDQVTAAREYTDEEKAKKAKEKQELESSIKSLLSDLPEFTPQNQIKSKINEFLS